MVNLSCQPKNSSLYLEQTKMIPIPFEINDNYSASYAEAISFYQQLAKASSLVTIEEIGPSDSGRPLHAVIIGDSSIKNAASAKNAGKTVLFINNAIHPGEPCGVDASMLLTRDLIFSKKLKNYLEKTIIVLIPIYNISGALNRGSYSRANQQGPEFYGFRGNVRNYDLNRDFIKCDTKNAQTFNAYYTQWDPDVFIDNHTSNGADYPYVITLIATQKDKLHPILSENLSNSMLPFLYQKMEETKYEMTPYVYSRNTPDDGIAAFLDLPRYSSGYAAMHHSYSFMPETHMLKQFKDRVWSTYHFMVSMLDYLQENGEMVRKSRENAKKATIRQKEFPLNWTIDMDKASTLKFKGYTAEYKPSKVTGKDRLFYNHDLPYTKEIPYFNTYKAISSVQSPKEYIIPQAYDQIIHRLKWNGVKMEQLQKDTVLDVEVYYIEDLESRKMAYEGHFLHSNVVVRKENQKLQFFQGDFKVTTNQEAKRYLVEVLEPEGPDSFFAWNFMDGILMQKEYFSSYVFEETAEKLLSENDDLKKLFVKKKQEDEKFADNARAQLNFIYTHSPYYEKSYRRYPIARIIE